MAEEGTRLSGNAYLSTLTSLEPTTTQPTTIIGRLRAKSQSLAETAWNFNRQPGMWAATGTAIAHAPPLTELREPIASGENIEFNGHGHSARTVTTDEEGSPMLSTTLTRMNTVLEASETTSGEAKREKRPPLERQQHYYPNPLILATHLSPYPSPHLSPRILQIRPHTHRIPHVPLRPQHHSLGRDAIFPPPRRGASYGSSG